MRLHATPGFLRSIFGESGAQGRIRTTDTVIFSHVLYQLSYLGMHHCIMRAPLIGNIDIGVHRPVPAGVLETAA